MSLIRGYIEQCFFFFNMKGEEDAEALNDVEEEGEPDDGSGISIGKKRREVGMRHFQLF